MKNFFIIFCIMWLLTIISCIFNIKFEQRINELKQENNKLILELQEKDQLIENYQYGINQIQFFDECFIGE